MKKYTKSDIKKTAIAALKSEYGFEPKQQDVILLEACDDRTYILFEVRGHEYSFRSYKLIDDSVWVGSGTIEKRS